VARAGLRVTSRGYVIALKSGRIRAGAAGFVVVRALLRNARIRSGKRLRLFRAAAIVSKPSMHFRPWALVAVVLLSSTPAWADDRSAAKSQVEFGIKVAQSGLWKEARYRWERAVELDPTYAQAWNNLAIAYEHEGKFDEARKAYEKALELDPKNLLIRQNYDLFKEINDRTQKRRGDR
jgi:tetratricopeptide (TPR) repeat protein